MVDNRQDKESLLEELHSRFGAAVERKCMAILGNVGDAQDAKQETFVIVFRKVDGFETRPGLGYLPWIYAIANNVCLHILRSRRNKRKETPLGELGALEPADPIYPERVVSNRDLLMAIFDKLDKRSRQVFVGYYLDGMTQEQVAACCGITRRTVINRLKKIRECAASYCDAEGKNG